jgi:DNA-binding protein YbaB
VSAYGNATVTVTRAGVQATVEVADAVFDDPRAGQEVLAKLHVAWQAAMTDARRQRQAERQGLRVCGQMHQPWGMKGFYTCVLRAGHTGHHEGHSGYLWP